MALVRALAERRSATSQLSNPADWLISLLGGGKLSRSGQRVTPETALSNMAVWNAIRILSSTVASIPLMLYRRLPGGGREVARDHPLFALTHKRPNPWQTSYEWREMLTGHLELRGNAYSRIQWDRRGKIVALTPLHPDRMVVYIGKDESLLYKYVTRFGESLDFQAEEILHLRGLASDSVVGYSPIGVARETIGVGLAAEEYTGAFFGNSATPGGVLQHPAKLSKGAYERLKANMEARYSGAENAGRTMILEEGLQWTQVGMTSKDAQFLETRKFGVEEIARLFDIPVHMLKELARSTNNNIEQQGMEFVTYTMSPRLVRIEQRMDESLLLEREQDEYFFKFLVDGLARGDTNTRYAAYAIGRNWGLLSADEVRDMENMNPIPDGEGKEYLRPVNMTGIEDPPPVPGALPGAPAPKKLAAPNVDDEPEPTDDDEDVRARLIAASREVLMGAFDRCARKEVNAARRQLEKAPADTAAARIEWHEAFWRQQADYVLQELRPGVRMIMTASGARDDEAMLRSLVGAAVAREQEAARTAFATAAPGGETALRALLDRWQEERGDAAATREREALIRTLSGPDQ